MRAGVIFYFNCWTLFLSAQISVICYLIQCWNKTFLNLFTLLKMAGTLTKFGLQLSLWLRQDATCSIGQGFYRLCCLISIDFASTCSPNVQYNVCLALSTKKINFVFVIWNCHLFCNYTFFSIISLRMFYPCEFNILYLSI